MTYRTKRKKMAYLLKEASEWLLAAAEYLETDNPDNDAYALIETQAAYDVLMDICVYDHDAPLGGWRFAWEEVANG